MKLIKKVTGIDISKDTFTVCLGTLDDKLDQRISRSFDFNNDLKGFKKLLKLISNFDLFRPDIDVPVQFVVEATGIYHENLAYFLNENDFFVSVVLPNKTNHFLQTLKNKSKTDSLDAAGLTQYGLEKQLDQWFAPNPIFKELKELTRELDSITAMLTQLKNRLHAKEHAHQTNDKTIKRLNQQVDFFKKQRKLINEQIKALVRSDKDLNDRIKKITTTKGIGFQTAVSVICETNGFELIQNQRQLTSYAGLDPRHNQSGLFKGKSTISKRGNSRLRNAVFMPALSAATHNPELKKVYKRLCKTKNIKRIALIAVARKLLILIYTLWKNNTEFILNHKMKKQLKPSTLA